ncbi:MAG: two-component regulator propeller domain-containing protein [Chryseolinea sp.]
MKCFYFLTAWLLSCTSFSQTVFFNNISQDDGLRNGNVRAIVKDYQGFIWIGTEDGLHRYDGYTMKIYAKIEGDSSSIGSNFILCLFEDSHKNLWVGTLDGGLYVYQRKADSFKHFDLRMANDSAARVTIRSLAEGKDKYLYVGTDDLFRSSVTNPEAMEFSKVPFATDAVSGVLTRFAAIEQDLDSNLLVSVNSQGLFSLNLSTGKSSPHPISELDKDIYTVYADKQRNLIWAGSLKRGLLIYDPVHKRHLRVMAGRDEKTLRSNFVPSIAGDARGNIWIAADNGLSMVSSQTDPFKQLVITTYLPGKSDITRIHGNIMKTVYVDDKDRVWAGTIYEGVNIYDRNAMNFGSLNILTDVNSLQSYGNINAVQEDQLGDLWMGLDGGGLYKFSGQFNSSEQLAPEPIVVPDNIDKIKALKFDRDNHLWIGTWGNGLLVYYPVSHQVKRIDASHSGLDIGTEIMALNIDGDENLWVGSFDKGLFRYQIRSGKVDKITGHGNNLNRIDRVNAICVDKGGNLWVGKDVGGLNFLKKGSTNYAGITTTHLHASTTITSIYQDRAGIVWVGAPNIGLVRYDPLSNTSEVFNENQGLNDFAVHAIQEDSLHRLWISHNAGISMFEKDVKVFRNFDKGNGIAASQFNNSSSIERKNGQMVFGHIHGINFFNPKDFNEDTEATPVVFTRFFVDNVEQSPGGSSLSENIVAAKEIKLQHDQNSFSAEFATLNFAFSRRPQNSYMLEGFDSDWQPAGQRRLISYTNLEPGTYTLKVRSSNGLTNESTSIREIRITIIPAWWQTYWFKVLVAATAALIAVVLHRVRIDFLMQQTKLLEFKVDIRTQKLSETNQQLQIRIDEINSMNSMLKKHQLDIFEKNNEIQAQNEELQSQNEQIFQQQDNLVIAREQLREINTNLEQTVSERTDELKRTINDLNKTVFELDRFVYSASHDLSAPLKSIHGLVELIKLEDDRTKILEYADYIKRTVLKLEDVIKSMIDYSRNTHILVKTDVVNLKELIDEVTLELAFWQEASKIAFLNNIPDFLQIHTDRARVKVVLHNLVSNSIKYRDQNKDSNWIKFECVLEDKHWQLTISDNGIGIRAEYLEKVFNMYFRATENSKGSGLGLFIVKETLRKVNGTIKVESKLGEYTNFILDVATSEFRSTNS